MVYNTKVWFAFRQREDASVKVSTRAGDDHVSMNIGDDSATRSGSLHTEKRTQDANDFYG